MIRQPRPTGKRDVSKVKCPAILDLFFLKIVPAAGIYGYDQRTELLYMAVPQRLRHAQILPLRIYDLLHLDCGYDRVASEEYAVQRTEFFARTLCIFLHAALADDDAYTCRFYKLVLEFLHAHRGGRTYGDHLVLLISQRMDDGSRVQDGQSGFL